jgi:hypothetical protein
MRTYLVASTILLAAAAATGAQARQWSDASGNYTVEADLIAFDDQKVILQRADRQLASFEVAMPVPEQARGSIWIADVAADRP